MKKLRLDKFKLEKGFTLIELLIVLVIIGLLAAFLMANFAGLRARARDGQRKSEIGQIQSALEMYRSDQGIYPLSIPDCNGDSFSNETDSIIYMEKISCDPLGSDGYNLGNYFYESTNGSSYTLVACLENTKDPQGTGDPPAGAKVSCTTGYYYAVQSQ